MTIGGLKLLLAVSMWWRL